MRVRKQTKLNGIFLENFQSIKDPTFIKLKDLTFLFGPNSAGKSSLIDALLFLQARLLGEDHISGLQLAHRNVDNPREKWWSTDPEATMKVGISVEPGKDWSIQLWEALQLRLGAGNPFKEETKETSLFEKLRNYKSVKIEYEFGEHWRYEWLVSLKIAVDEAPILAVTISDDGLFYFNDYDLDNDNPEDLLDLIVIYHRHPFWKDHFGLTGLVDSVRNSKHPGLSSLMRLDDEKLCISDIETMFALELGGKFPTLKIGPILHDVFNGANGLRLVKPWEKSQSVIRKIKKVLNSPIQDKENDHDHDQVRWRLESLIDDLSGLLFSINVMASKLTGAFLVSGDRSVLGRDETEYLVSGYREPKSPNDLFPIVALAVASANSRDKNFKESIQFAKSRQGGASVETSVKTLNEWLYALTKLDQGYRFYADAYCLKKKSGYKLSSNISDYSEALYVKLYVVDKKGRSFEIADVGSGVSHVIPILVSLWALTSTWVQQPELHLHPAAQCELGDIFLSAAKLGHSSVIETHSEHLLLRVLRRIRETTDGIQRGKLPGISNEALAVYYFEPLDSGSTKVREIRVSRDGDFIDHWPKGFFTERAQELFS